jgi:hypothetical protein
LLVCQAVGAASRAIADREIAEVECCLRSGGSLVEWAEHVCAENTQWFPGQEAAVPTEDKPNF